MKFKIRRGKKEPEESFPPFESFGEEFVQQPSQEIPQQSVEILGSRVDLLDSSVAAIRGWVEDARSRITALESTINDTVVPIKNDFKEVRKDIGLMNEKLQQLMALYEVISTQYNPFIETSAAPPSAGEGESKEEEDIERLLRSVAPEQFPEASTEGVVEVPESYESMGPEFAELAPITEEEFGIEPMEGYEGETISEGVLSRISDTYSSNAFAIKLLEFIISKIGRKNLPDILEYYESIGWIGKEARRQLLEMASGVSVKEGFAIDWKLSAADNLKALQFIQEIRGRPIKKSELEEIERKAEKIKGV